MTRGLVLSLVLMACAHSAAKAAELTQADKATVVDAIVAHLETDYVDAPVGQRAADSLRQLSDSGAFDNALSGQAFAESLGSRLQALTGDGHLNVEYSADPVQQTDDGVDAYSASEIERWYGAHLNFGVERIERLENNVGLIDLRVFAPIDMGGATIAAAMNVVAHMDALIIDLRNNGGGIGDMANLVASYVFGPEPQPLTGVYDRPADTLTQRFTQAYVSGARFGPDRPVYVLISRKTFSAAEALAYDLQALERATIVGEPSGGGAHPFEYVPIHPHFVLWSVTARSVNPITGKNWQGVGVQPDIRVPAEQALGQAVKHFRANRQDRRHGSTRAPGSLPRG